MYDDVDEAIGQVLDGCAGCAKIGIVLIIVFLIGLAWWVS